MGIRNDTSFKCRKCNLALCIEPCFEIYHTQRNFISENNNSDEDNSSSSSYNEEETEKEVIESDGYNDRYIGFLLFRT